MRTPSHYLMIFATVTFLFASSASPVLFDRRATMSAPLFLVSRLLSSLDLRSYLPEEIIYGGMSRHKIGDPDGVLDGPLTNGGQALLDLGFGTERKQPLALLSRTSANVPKLQAARV